MRRFGWLIVAALATTPALAQQAASEATCGGLANAFGPFDYRSDHYRPTPGDNQPWAEKLSLVERGHFTPQVEALIRGASTYNPGPDLDYTLRAIPNHHRALASLLRLFERTKNPAPAGLPRSIECYFDRAVRFVPKDPIVRLFFASLLIKQKRVPEAKTQIQTALDLAGDNAFSHYNIGLIYLEAGDHEAALRQAHRAMALGFPRQELKQRLVVLGKWVDPPPAVADVSAAESTAVGTDPPAPAASAASATAARP